MNKNMMVLSIMLVVLPGCFGRKEKGQPIDIEGDPVKSVGYQKSDEKSVFNEDVEGFVLEEEGFDPFAGSDEDSVMLVNAGHDGAQESAIDHKVSQAAYGFKTLYFDFDKYDIRKDQKEMLDHDVRAVQKVLNEGMDVIVEGHTDKAGSAQYNMQLSDKRAESVARYFVDHGIPAERIKVVGRGFEMPIVASGTIDQQAPNRRVEFYAVTAQEQYNK